jgi:hypothetical protein
MIRFREEAPVYARRTKLMAAAQRSSERRQRENDAPRLRESVPTLESLQLELVEHAGTNTTAHRKHVVVASAPALFLIPCGDKECRDGGHDITHEVMRSLQQKSAQISGEHVCEGQVGSAPCTRRLQYQTRAIYLNPEQT